MSVGGRDKVAVVAGLSVVDVGLGHDVAEPEGLLLGAVRARRHVESVDKEAESGPERGRGERRAGR